jgi:hypothetical protein
MWLAGGTVALPALNCLQRGQVGIVLAYLLVLGLRLIVVHGGVAAIFSGGVVLALAATIKVTPALPAGLLASLLLAQAHYQMRSYSAAVADGLARGPLHRAFATGAGLGVGLMFFLILIPGLVIGHRDNVMHLRTWMDRVAANDEVGIDNDFNVKSMRNQSLANAVERLGNRIAFATGIGPDDRLVDDLSQQTTTMPMDAPWVQRALQAASFSLLLLLVVAAWRVARRDDPARLVAVFGLACAATLVLSPISWGHPYVVWLPALVFVPAWLWRNGRQALAIAMAETALVLSVAHYVVLDHAGRVGLLGIGVSVWYVAAAISIGWSPQVDAPACVEVLGTNNSHLSEIPRRRAA